MPDTCDTSLLLPALLEWHPGHRGALAIMRDRVASIPAHVYVETFSAITRLPDPRRPSPALAGAALTALDRRPLALPATAHLTFVQHLAAAGLGGGATYDGLVAATASHHHHRLLTADRRARVTYDAVGVDYEFVELSA